MKAGWQIKALGDVCDVIGGGTPSKNNADFYTGEIPWATVRDMRSDVIAETEFGITEAAVKSSATNVIPSGNVVIATRVGLGKVCLLDQDTAINQDLRGIVPKDGKQLAIRYLFWWLKSIAPVIVAEGRGATVQGVKLPFVKSLKIPLPPIPEQKRIIAILDDAFAGIAKARVAAEQNRQNARALFESVLGSVEGETAVLGDYVTIKTGKLDANAAVEGGIYPFFTCAREIFAIDNFAFDCEAILLAGNNAVGNFNVKHYSGKFNAYQRTYVITINNKDQLLYRFLYFQMLKSLKRFKEQSLGAGTKFLKLGMIKNLEIALPSLDEQGRFVSTLEAVLEETQKLESLYQRKLDALDELKQSLLQQAFSGNL
ncbi:restriction endonuclease subunit S [Pseudomonas sp. SWI6]|uniref:restriction endonuclease subunit S n=1 Tax=Pseudomonas sp. SWI6 TaxID=2083051 RepID=UPI000CE5E9E6|nr:restriction endonuclease subunit S [Pseudomonas sp. SWI6]AVD84931.1 restriction endonuclease subunit S [Pseudomonas sp. SWI6]